MLEMVINMYNPPGTYTYVPGKTACGYKIRHCQAKKLKVASYIFIMSGKNKVWYQVAVM